MSAASPSASLLIARRSERSGMALVDVARAVDRRQQLVEGVVAAALRPGGAHEGLSVRISVSDTASDR